MYPGTFCKIRIKEQYNGCGCLDGSRLLLPFRAVLHPNRNCEMVSMIRKEWVTSVPGMAALSALGSGTAVHLFGLVNVIHNYDDIAQQARGYGTGVTSGRWLLSLLGDFCDAIGGNHNLPLVNGMLFLVLIAVSAGLLVSAFGIRQRNHAAMIGALFAVFPTAFSTLVFRYTAAYYSVGIVFSVLAAWILAKPYKMRLVWSALCTACSLGIYQAYVPITIAIFVIQLLSDSLRKDVKLEDLIRQGVSDCISLVLGLLFYFGLMKLTLMLYGTQLSDYQGVNEMGKLSLQTLPVLLKEAVYSVIMLPVKDYCGVTAMTLLKLAYILLVGSAGVMLVFLWWKVVKKPLIILFGMLMCCLIPVAVNFIVIMCPESWIYTLMIYSFVLLPCIPTILLERIEDAADHLSLSPIFKKA